MLLLLAFAQAAPPPVLPGTFQLTGIDPTGVAAWVDGQPARWDGTSFLVERLAAGYHDVRVVRGTATLFAGSMRVFPELIRRCVPDGPNLTCVHTETLVPVAAAAPVAIVPTKLPISATELAAVTAALQAQPFAADRIATLTSAAATRWFTIAQVGTLLDLFSSGGDKVDAVRILAPRVVDPENAFDLDRKLLFSTDKEEVHTIFGR